MSLVWILLLTLASGTTVTVPSIYERESQCTSAGRAAVGQNASVDEFECVKVGVTGPLAEAAGNPPPPTVLTQ